jgi:hypothetical protein
LSDPSARGTIGRRLSPGGAFRLGWLFKPFQVNKVAEHFLRREVVEQAQHPLEQKPVLTAAKLLGHDDASMGARGRLPSLDGEERNRGC